MGIIHNIKADFLFIMIPSLVPQSTLTFLSPENTHPLPDTHTTDYCSSNPFVFSYP